MDTPRFSRLLLPIMASVCVLGASRPAEPKGKSAYHCEKKEGSKTVDLPEVKSRRDCKKQGGKWVRGHHDHHHHDGEGKDSGAGDHHD